MPPATRPLRSEPSQQPAPPPLFGHRGPPGMPQMEIKRAKDTRGVVLRLWGYLRHQKAALILTVCLVVISSGLGLMGPYLMGRAIDRYIMQKDLHGLVGICLLMLGIYATSSFFTWLQSYCMAGAAQRTVRDIRNDLFIHLQGCSLRFFDQRSHGDLMSRLTNDVESLSMVLSESVPQIISGVLSMIGIVIAMIWLNPILAAISIGTIASISLGLNRIVTKRTRANFRRQQAALGALNGLIEETVTGQRVVKAYHRYPIVLKEFDAANGELRQAATHAQVYSGFIGPLMNAINNSGLAIVAGSGGVMAVMGLASVGTIASFINYSRMFGRPLNEIANLYNSIQSAMAGAERVFEVIDHPADIDAVDGKPLSEIRGEVFFEDVNFSYEPGKPILKQFCLYAQPGQVIALIGPTGAGKTTIVNLLTRFYEIDAGRILIDGQDIRHIHKDDLRRQLGIVLQDTFLFSGSVRENIRYGRLDATDEEIIAAATLANADQFIRRLPQGYDTPLSERANNLSHGQRQLLAIARAILANPRILILDEATSSVDTRTEKHIQEAMLRLMAGRTSFVIAHRLSTIREADQILVINRGEVIEHGTHDSLLAQQGFYHRLVNNQIRSSGS